MPENSAFRRSDVRDRIKAIVPFCGRALVETLVARRTEVIDPVLDLLWAQQPAADFVAFQRDRLKRQAEARLAQV